MRANQQVPQAVGALLMDQTVIAGIGNVYRTELLFRHRIDPFRPGTDVSAAEFDALWTDLVALMRAGVRRGRIITTDPSDDRGAPRMRRGSPRTYVYRRAGGPVGSAGRRCAPSTGRPQPVLVPYCQV